MEIERRWRTIGDSMQEGKEVKGKTGKTESQRDGSDVAFQAPFSTSRRCSCCSSPARGSRDTALF